MPEVSESLTVNLPTDQIWQLIGAFDAIHVWHPAIDATETYDRDGVTYRRLTLTSGRYHRGIDGLAFRRVQKLQLYDDRLRDRFRLLNTTQL